MASLSEELSTSAYQVVIFRTEHGIPHIAAGDYASLGYGHGYAYAQDNLCSLAEEVVTLNAERSRYFDPDGTYTYHTLNIKLTNLESDFYYQLLKDEGTVEALLSPAPDSPSQSPSQEVRELVRGYAAGYNRYLRDTGVGSLPDPRCRGATWVRPITELDLYRRYYQLTVLLSRGFFMKSILGAKPPSHLSSSGTSSSSIDPSVLPNPESLFIGSNAYALGREATGNSRGMLLANPHFPWQGIDRFYQVHLTIPNKLNVSGASLHGFPLVLIGHTEKLAWTHTVSTAYRFTPYELTLVPGRPTAYLHEGQPREMTPRTVTVMARQSDGRLEPHSHTFYRSVHGLVFHHEKAFPWTSTTGYALGDVNANNLRMLDQYLAMGNAQSVTELRQAQDKWQGVPFINTLAADSEGNAYYADASVVPHVTDKLVERCVTSPANKVTYQLYRLPILDGSRAECTWGGDPDAIEPGIFGPSRLPRLFRTDYVSNSNDSHWLVNPKQPLTGYPRIIGDERTALSLRTRLALKMLQQHLAGPDGLGGQKLTLDHLQTLVFNNRNYSGELLRDQVVEMCQRNHLIPIYYDPTEDVSTDSILKNVDPGTTTRVSESFTLENVKDACPVLAAWNLRGDLDSNGSVLWHEFYDRARKVTGGPFLVPFDAQDPINTPHTLNPAHPQLLQALGRSVRRIREWNLPLDVSFHNTQFALRSSTQIPIHGCHSFQGCFNVIAANVNPKDGTWDIYAGSSFVMVTSFTEQGPVSRSILTYSQSANPESPHFLDQTRKYSDKLWVTMRFSEHDITNDPHLTVTRLQE